MTLTKKSNYLRSTYFLKQENSFGPFTTPINFYIDNGYLLILNLGNLNGEDGTIDFYDIRNQTIFNSFKIKGNPKYIEKFGTDKFIVVKHLKQGIFLFDLKTGREELFISGDKFLNPASVLLKNNKIYITDVFGHKIKIFSEKGEYIDEIDLKGKAEFPIEIKKIEDFFIILTLGRRVFYPEYSSGKTNESPLFHMKGTDVKALDFCLTNSCFPFTGLDVTEDKTLYILNTFNLYKYELNNGCIFKKNLRALLSFRKPNSFFYKNRIHENKIYILERVVSKRIFIFRIKE